MHRRDFIKVVAGSAVPWPLAAHAQQPVLPVVGFINVASAEGYAPPLSAFLEGLSEAVTSMAVTSRSNTAGRRVEATGCRRWRLTWFIVM
jgi:hypothetical protein